MNRIFIALVATVISFAACKTSVHVHFNKDHSGFVEMEFDMSELIANSSDSTGNLLDSLAEGMNSADSIPFIKNYKISTTKKGIKISYEFTSIENLNHSLAFMNDQSDSAQGTVPPVFKAKRNKIIYKTPGTKTKPNENAEAFAEFFVATYRVSFEKKIVKCNNKKYTWNKEENYIELSGGLNDYKLNKDADFTVKLK